jgi:hypothetical protein
MLVLALTRRAREEGTGRPPGLGFGREQARRLQGGAAKELSRRTARLGRSAQPGGPVKEAGR